MGHASGILQGDLAVIDPTNYFEKKKADALNVQQIDETRELSERYLKIDTALAGICLETT